MDEISMISTTAILSLMIWKRSPAANAEKAKPTVLEAVAATKTAAKAIARGRNGESSNNVCSVMRSPVTGKKLFRVSESFDSEPIAAGHGEARRHFTWRRRQSDG